MISAIVILLILFFINGIFVMAEISLVSARKSKLDLDAQHGDKASKLALEHANTPTRILSTIQIAITIIGILTGVYSSDEITASLAAWLSQSGLSISWSESLALAIVVIIVTFVSLVFGELVPKRIGLMNAERIARFMIRPMLLFAAITWPFTWLLTHTTDLIMKILRVKPSADSKVTEEEIKAMLQEGTEDGEVQEIEQDIVERVFHLGDRMISSLMTHHSDLVWLDVQDSTEEIQKKIGDQLHSVYPICEDDLDNVKGVIFIKDLVLKNLSDESFNISELVRPAQFVLETITAYEALELFKLEKIHYGLVVDEYGSTVGMVTLNDILEALVGDFNEPNPDEPRLTPRDDGSWLVDGQMSFYEFAYELEIQGFDKNKIKFDTLAGLAMSILRHIPKPGEKFTWKEFEFEVVDLDGNRIDKLIVKKVME